MIITITSSDARSSKAAQIAASAGQWLKCRRADGSKRYGIPSQSVVGRYYLTDTRSCTCPDALQNLGLACKHMLAVRIHVERVRAQQQRGVRLAA